MPSKPPILLLLGILLLVPGPERLWARSPDCSVLARIDGSWMGRGSLQRYLVSGTEPVRCRFDTSWAAAQRQLTHRLDCRGVDGDLSFAGSIGVSGQDGALSGSLTGSQGLDDGKLEGWCEARSVRLHLTGRNPTTGEPVEGDLTIAVGEEGESLVQTLQARDPESGEVYPALSLTLTR
jgi:hypothetical protein